MPAVHSENSILLDSVARALTRSSTAALEASDELLAHYIDTGDAATQRAVETLIDHSADALRTLRDSLAEIATALPAAGLSVAQVEGRRGR